jgi:hypothetical protein
LTIKRILKQVLLKQKLGIARNTQKIYIQKHDMLEMALAISKATKN